MKKTKSLGFKFGIIFSIYAVVTILISAVMTYVSQTDAYHHECRESAMQITTNIKNNKTQLASNADSCSIFLRGILAKWTRQLVL